MSRDMVLMVRPEVLASRRARIGYVTDEGRVRSVGVLPHGSHAELAGPLLRGWPSREQAIAFIEGGDLRCIDFLDGRDAVAVRATDGGRAAQEHEPEAAAWPGGTGMRQYLWVGKGWQVREPGCPVRVLAEERGAP